MFRARRTGVVHVECRKRYTIPSDINRAAKLQPSTSGSGARLRSTQPEFEFKTKCFLCTENIDDTFYTKQKKLKIHLRRKVYQVISIDFDRTIAKQAHDRNDDWGNTAIGRMNNVADLQAADAIYHEDCYRKLFLVKAQTGQKRGRPQEDFVASAMEEIFHYLDEQDKDQYSMDELMDQISGEKPEMKWAKTKMVEKYGERIIFSKIRTHKTVVCFRDVGEKILNDAWYESRSNNNVDECIRVVQTAAAIIRKDIQSRAYDTKSYAPSDEFLNGAQGMVPATLSAFIPKKRRKSRRKECALLMP